MVRFTSFLLILTFVLLSQFSFTQSKLSKTWEYKDITDSIDKTKVVSLSINQYILYLPKDIKEFTNLKRLDLNQCTFIRDISELKHLVHLEEISMNNCNLKKVPEELSKLKKLKKINLNSNLITDYSALAKLTEVEEIQLGSCGLKEIPKEIRGYSNLKLLNLRNSPSISLAGIGGFKK